MLSGSKEGTVMFSKKIFPALYIVLLIMIIAGCGAGGPSGSSGSVGTGSAVVSWNTVTQYTNGDPLTPTGYKIRYGTTSGTYTTTVTVLRSALSNPNAPRYTVRGLVRGVRYYFTTTAYDSSNIESALSSVVSGTIH
jgi:hypothetical protein